MASTFLLEMVQHVFFIGILLAFVPEDLISIAVHTGGETVLTQSDRSRTHILCRH